MILSQEGFLSALIDAQLGPWSAHLAAACRPCYSLQIADLSDRSFLDLGANRLGGWPDMPPGMPWPERGPHKFRFRYQFHDEAGAGEKRPLSFLAQIDLTTVQGVCLDLPSSGRLLFFYDAIEKPTGNLKSNEGTCAVLYDESPIDDLVRRKPPGYLNSMIGRALGYFEPVGIKPAKILQLPPPDSMAFEHLQLGASDTKSHNELCARYEALLGHA